MSRCGPNKITLLVGAPKHDQRTMCVPAVRTNRYMMAGRLAAGAAAAVASSSAAASDMAVGSVYIIYKYWGRVLEQHVLPHGRAPTAPDGANFQTEKWTVFQVQQLHPSKYIYICKNTKRPTDPLEICTRPSFHVFIDLHQNTKIMHPPSLHLYPLFTIFFGGGVLWPHEMFCVQLIEKPLCVVETTAMQD